MMRKILAGTTSFIHRVWIRDTSVTSRVAGLTGLVYNTSGLTLYYSRAGQASDVAVSLVTATVGTFTSSGFKEVDATNMPGLYEIGIPNAALTGAVSVAFVLRGAANMDDTPFMFELDAVNYQSATAFITGVNSLAPPTNWNLEVIDGSGRVDVSKVGGTSQTARDLGASVLLSPGTGTGQLDITSGVVKANLVQILSTALTETVGGYLAAAFKKLFDVVTPVLTAASVNQTGDAYGRVGAAGAGLTALGDTRIANLDAAVTSRAVTGDAMALTPGERNSVADALLDRVNAIETSFTVRQSLRILSAALAGKLSGAAGTTVTIRNVGDSKDRVVATVDSSGNRTSITLDAT